MPDHFPEGPEDSAHGLLWKVASLLVLLVAASVFVIVYTKSSDSLAAANGAPATLPPNEAKEVEPEPEGEVTEAPSATNPSVVPNLGFKAITNPQSGFAHPGVLVNVRQLESVRNKLLQKSQPWYDAYLRMRRSSYAQLDWSPGPWTTVECGYYSNPDHGCTVERADAIAAYTQTLMYYFTGREDYARKAVAIINGWSGKLERHVDANAALQAGWAGAMFARAAELLRYTYPAWGADHVTQAQAMFRNAFLPRLTSWAPAGSEGNWDLTIIDAVASIAVFLDDRPLFDRAVARWRARVPAYLYLSSDGGRPVGPPGGTRSILDYWHGQTTYVDGLTQETCRDMSHAGWGIEALVQTAETARLQGLDLYGEVQDRLVAALELHAGLAMGEPVPGWLCGGRITATYRPIPEIAYYQYRIRIGIDMPRTKKLIEAKRPQNASHFYAWETLTSAVP